MQDATSITMAGETVVAQRVIGGARVAPGVAVARQTGRLGLGETVVQIAGQVRRAISRGQQHDRTNCDRPDENRQPCPTKVPLHREYVTLPNVQRALTRDALLILLVVLAAGTLANFIPSRHLAWWGKGQEPPQVDVDFRLIDPGSAEVMRTSLPGVVFLDTRSAASFATGHVPGAIPTSYTELPAELTADRLATLRKANAVILYGAGEETDVEQLLGQELRRRGLPPPHVLVGGFEGWLGLGLPTESAT